MNNIKKALCTLAICFFAFVSVTVDAFAAVRVVTTASCRLTVEYKYEEKALENARFRLYKVGEISEDAVITLDTQFDPYNIVINPTDFSSLATTAKELDNTLKIFDTKPYAISETNQQGQIIWENLPVGVYLLSGDPLSADDKIYTSSPQLVFLPARNSTDSDWNYNQLVTVKNTAMDQTEKTISLSVQKRWDDAGYEDKRPASVTVNLLCDNQRYDSIVLSADNGWTHTWTGLSGKRNWSVEEIVPENYIARTEFNGSRFILTNSRENIPDTGVLWWPVPVMILIGSICIGYGIYIRKRI